MTLLGSAFIAALPAPIGPIGPILYEDSHFVISIRSLEKDTLHHMALERTAYKVKNGRKKLGILQGILGNA